jgi:hypothetical protein
MKIAPVLVLLGVILSPVEGIFPAVLILGGAATSIIGAGLTAAGFGTTGIVGGSIAAGVQAGIGNIVAGSTFAALQSAGMTGAIATATSAGAAAVAAGAAMFSIDQSDEKKKQMP